jgi:ankyrin repeat protein
LPYASALHAASAVGDVQFLEYLVDLGGDVTPEDLGHVLLKLAKSGHNGAASMLIDAGADLGAWYSSVYGDGPALYEALKRRDLDLVTRLLDAGANPKYGQDFFLRLNWRKPLIQLAIKWGNFVVVKRLIFEGADLNDCSGWDNCSSALTLAVEHGNTDLVKILFEAGADVNHPNTRLIRGRTPLAAAAKLGDKGIIWLLFDYGADSNAPCAYENAASEHIVDLLV